MMKYQVIFGALLASFCQAQWTPDPFCPFPSDHVTRYQYYGNCSVYWECYNGAKYVMECPEGLEFNSPLQQCDTPSIANCDPYASTTANPNPPTYTTESTISTPRQPGPDCPTDTDELVYYPYDGDCTRYWECYEGNSYLYTCPGGLWWHQDLSECDYPGDFCTDSTSPNTVSSITTDVTPNGNGEPNCEGTGDEPVYYPYPGDCTKYWECADSKLYEYDCPDGLWWHQDAGACDYPGTFCSNFTSIGTEPTVITEETVTSSPVLTSTASSEPQCDGSDDDQTYYTYPEDCTKYWECANGELYLYECPEGLWWNPGSYECDYPGSFCDNSTSIAVF